MCEKLLVIAPHSYCTDEKIRHCDMVVPLVISSLRKEFYKHDVVFHLSDQKRIDGDYNRPETDGSVWREKGINFAKTNDPNFVLEIHSYPGSHKYYKDIWYDSELVIFKSTINADFIDVMITMLKKNDPSLKVMIGYPDHPVSITDDMAKNNKKHSLFEFNEELQVKRILEISHNVSQTILEMINKKQFTKSKFTVSNYIYIIIIIAIIIITVLLFSSYPLLSHRSGYKYLQA
jgi:hypothetical protein